MYVVLICARNEEKYIGACLNSVREQTVSPEEVVVVDDGSRDATGATAHENGALVLRNPDRGFSALGTPYMADTYNLGLDLLYTLKWDFLLVLGADTWIPPEYVESLLEVMTPELGVVSGQYPGIRETYASATGRFSRREILDELGGRLPRSHAWESSVLHCAEYLGYEIRSFPVDIVNMRPPGAKKRGYIGRGKAERDLGHYWPYALARGVRRILLGDVRMGLSIIVGYLAHRPEEPLPDWAKFKNDTQKQNYRQALIRRLKNDNR